MERFLTALLAHITQCHQTPHDLADVTPLTGKLSGVDDSGTAYRLQRRGASGDAILTVANSRFPESVAIAVKQARDTRDLLGAKRDQSVVVTPVATGYFEGRSYALWPRKSPLSSNRVWRKMQSLRINKPVIDWLIRVGKETRVENVSVEALSERFITPLQYLQDDPELPGFIKEGAARHLNRLQLGEIKPVFVLQHGDFWLGNVLLPVGHGSTEAPRFHVIDWGGAERFGYPFIDCLRYVMSVRLGDMGHSDLRRYAREMGLPIAQLPLYVCVALGHLNRHLDCFPRARYLELADALYKTAESISGKTVT